MRYTVKLVLVSFIISLLSCNQSVKKTEAKRRALDSEEIVIDQPIGYKRSEDTSLKAQNQENHDERQKDTKLVYPQFIVNLHNFLVHNNLEDSDETAYDGDSSEVNINIEKANLWILTVKKDTIHLTNGDYSDFHNRLLEIVPKNKTGTLKISYSINVAINEAADANGVKWKGMTDYIPLKDSLTYFFRVPKFVDVESAVNKVKKKLKLRDTLIKYDGGDYGDQTEIGVLYKNRPCFIAPGDLNLKIQWLDRNKSRETKYIIFYETDID